MKVKLSNMFKIWVQVLSKLYYKQYLFQVEAELLLQMSQLLGICLNPVQCLWAVENLERNILATTARTTKKACGLSVQFDGYTC